MDFIIVFQLQTQIQYKSFACTQADILDIQARLQYYDIVEKFDSIIDAYSTISIQHKDQCNYWNTRVLQNCSSDYPVTSEEVTVQERHVVPLYNNGGVCSCQTSPLCEIITSTA